MIDNSIGNEADVGNDGVPDDDNYGVVYDRTDDTNPPSLPPESNLPCIHSTNIPSDEVNTLIDEVNEEYLFWRPHQDKEHPVDSIHASSKEDAQITTPTPVIRMNILSIKDVSSNLNIVAVTAADDDDDNNLNAKLQFEYGNSIVDLDGIQRDLSHMKRSNDEYHNNHNSINNDEADVVLKMKNQLVHSESIECNPSKIPNDGERVVLLSSVSRVVKNNNEEKNDEVSSISRMVMNNNDNVNTVDIRWYTVDNNNMVKTKLEWILKRYPVNNESIDDMDL